MKINFIQMNEQFYSQRHVRRFTLAEIITKEVEKGLNTGKLDGQFSGYEDVGAFTEADAKKNTTINHGGIAKIELRKISLD